MISITGVTGNYILQPETIEKHSKTLEWLSASVLWKTELTTFQKILDQKAPLFTSLDDKKTVDHFQNVITYYKGEVVDDMRKKLRDHESKLAHMLESKNESDTQYFKEHDAIMDQAATFSNLFTEFRTEFLAFTEKAKAGS
jgi:hypothetical protein